ncbi:MAG: FAD:protein FMN transferase [Sphaerochaetaceae bacterium]|nr:FAD:protein FMN transferase [Sphaerochaetaceae bacterium]
MKLNKILVAILIVFSLLMIGLIIADANMQKTTSDRYCLGTYCRITVYGKKAKAEKAIQSVWQEITELENAISVNLPYSEISIVNDNAGNGQFQQVSEQTYNLVKSGLELCNETEGALNIALGKVIEAWAIGTDKARVPSFEETDSLLKYCDLSFIQYQEKDGKFYLMVQNEGCAINLGAIGKGWATNIARNILRDNGIKNAIIDFGGNICVVGSMPKLIGSRAYKIGLQDPLSTRGEFFTTINVRDLSVVTSGSYERYLEAEDGHRYSHIIDPSTGRSIENNVKSVSIIGPDSFICDALSTALFVIGPNKANIFMTEKFSQYCAIFLIDNNGIDEVVRVGNIGILE